MVKPLTIVLLDPPPRGRRSWLDRLTLRLNRLQLSRLLSFNQSVRALFGMPVPARHPTTEGCVGVNACRVEVELPSPHQPCIHTSLHNLLKEALEHLHPVTRANFAQAAMV